MPWISQAIRQFIISGAVVAMTAAGLWAAEPAPPSPPAAAAPAPPEAPKPEAPAPAPAAPAPAPAPAPATPAPEAPKPEAPAPAAPAAPAPAAPAPAPAPAAAAPAASGTPVEQFDAAMQQWRETLKQLRQLQASFGTAKEADVPKIREEFKATLDRARQLIPKLRVTGGAAYADIAKQDRDSAKFRDIEGFLVKVLADDVTSDRYEEADALAKAMIGAGCDVRVVYDAGGIAAVCTNDYATAEADLKKAEQEGALSPKGKEYLSQLPELKKAWEDEKKIRDKEAQENNLPRVKIHTTKGDIVVELFENEAPDTVGNFISLVEKKFYNGLTFHRVLKQFMAQGGCPNGDGTGGPDYNIFCECYKDNYRRHFRGTLSMAHAGRDTGGSQFFLTFVPTSPLNGRHTAFGRVIEGMDVLANLQRIDPEDKTSKPEPDKMLSMEVVRKRDHEYKPSKVQ